MSAPTELLVWLPLRPGPDDEQTVLVACSDGLVYQGFRDGKIWRDAQAMPLPTPLKWAQWPVGPAKVHADAVASVRPLWTPAEVRVLEQSLDVELGGGR